MSDTPLLSLKVVQSTVGSPARWTILRELAASDSLMVSEIARKTGFTPSSVSKQLAQLIADRLVVNPRGRLFEINPQLPIDKTAHTLDLGHCLLRFNVARADDS